MSRTAGLDVTKIAVQFRQISVKKSQYSVVPFIQERKHYIFYTVK